MPFGQWDSALLSGRCSATETFKSIFHQLWGRLGPKLVSVLCKNNKNHTCVWTEHCRSASVLVAVFVNYCKYKMQNSVLTVCKDCDCVLINFQLMWGTDSGQADSGAWRNCYAICRDVMYIPLEQHGAILHHDWTGRTDKLIHWSGTYQHRSKKTTKTSPILRWCCASSETQ